MVKLRGVATPVRVLLARDGQEAVDLFRAKTHEIDLVLMGVIMVMNLSIALYTPPVGTTLFISSSIARVPILKSAVELLPFYAVALGTTLMFAFIPAMTL